MGIICIYSSLIIDLLKMIDSNELMDPLTQGWHSLHVKNVHKRERTHAYRLLIRKLDQELNRRKQAGRLHLNVPAHMSLLENYEETVEFINTIKRIVFEDGLFVFLNFFTCNNISFETCVVLAAEIDRCTRKIPNSVTGSYPKDPHVYFFLNEMGFFHLLNIRASKPIFDDETEIKTVRLQSGLDNPENLMRGIKELFYTEDGEKPQSHYSGNIFRALTEAMGNSIEHGYPEKFQEQNEVTCIPRWWRAGFKVKEDNSVLIILYDQGAGIPNTLETNWKEKLNALVSSLSREPQDHEKIDLAMEKGRSRTKIEGRGQGSYDMQSLIRESKNGVLDIFSYKGRYMYTSDGECTTEPKKNPLSGTLIVWSICLDVEESNAE